jgi:hypothetical protein
VKSKVSAPADRLRGQTLGLLIADRLGVPLVIRGQKTRSVLVSAGLHPSGLPSLLTASSGPRRGNNVSASRIDRATTSGSWFEKPTSSRIPMANRPVIIFSALAALLSSAFAQDLAKKAPKTELESFAAETGAVIIKGYTEVGTVNGAGGAVGVDSREFTNANTGKKSYGITISVTESVRLERSDTSFIDYQEISALIAGIDYISKITGGVTKLKQFEATYATKGDFSITVFNNASGKLSVAVSSGYAGRVSVFLGIEKLPELRRLIVSAKSQLEAIKEP